MHGGDLEHSLMKEKENRFSYIFLPIFTVCDSRFRFRNLKDANSCMFCIYFYIFLVFRVFLFWGTFLWEKIFNGEKYRRAKYMEYKKPSYRANFLVVSQSQLVLTLFQWILRCESVSCKHCSTQQYSFYHFQIYYIRKIGIF